MKLDDAIRSAVVFLTKLFFIASSTMSANSSVRTAPILQTGLWETQDGTGGAVGIDIEITKEVSGQAKTLDGATQTLSDVLIGAYRRDGRSRYVGDAVWISGKDPLFSWRNSELVVKTTPTGAWPALDLRFDPDHDAWTGHVKLDRFEREVRLTRLIGKGGGATGGMLGNWREDTSGGFRCYHIVKQADGGLAGWFDDITIPGRLRYAAGVTPLTSIREVYGQQGVVSQLGPRAFSFQVYTYTAGCCAKTFVGKVSDGGKTVTGGWDMPMNGSNVWHRAIDRACRR